MKHFIIVIEQWKKYNNRKIKQVINRKHNISGKIIVIIFLFISMEVALLYLS